MGLAALLAEGGCAESTPIDDVLVPDGGSGSNSGSGGASSGSGGSQETGGSTGSTGSGGSQGTGGTPGTGGGTGGLSATGGATGTGGVIGAGGNTASGGMMGTGGGRATGGATGSGGTGTGGGRATGGMTGSGGTGTGGGRATGGAGGSAAPTFTQVYQMILSVSCTGSQCHSPGTQGGVSFSSQSTAYSAVKGRVVAGNASGSSLYSLVNGGRMPPGNKLPAAQISLLAAWINAGALNN
ncbi:MAG TPA: hypothetical protein VHO67_15255 [Polyangia bacterium]|nr:hypothetical protein [Polyangia bacterium]